MKDKTSVIILRIPIGQKRGLEIIAKKQFRTVASVIREAIANHLSRQEKA